MPRGPRCCVCGARSDGRDKAAWHKEVTSVNVQLVQACLLTGTADGNGSLASKVVAGAHVCVDCWPAESMGALDGVLGAPVAFLEVKELV